MKGNASTVLKCRCGKGLKAAEPLALAALWVYLPILKFCLKGSRTPKPTRFYLYRLNGNDINTGNLHWRELRPPVTTEGPVKHCTLHEGPNKKKRGGEISKENGKQLMQFNQLQGRGKVLTNTT